ncbi:type II toxin-antitoxin system RelE/ParE family toxin [Empedobacter stercoris]|uniref:type II toxin-antitoxin system RelE/ParE family toxin n=1 Tax=Empedobacter stercoris TaxID=1628248 RepID=UPI001CE21D45|nr:type II toxin-antitoxin system RelE/ParE family toxin [Empedobacter stercoris]MCA4777119.1 type II toxin-antitoxin system RelE/ParE family toxin [Empedobacter stercoris]
MNYKISKQAEVDLENIWLYTFEEWSLEQADYYLDLIIDEIEYISENPKTGKNYNDFRKGYFRSRVKSHFIFYRINIKEEIVEIIRILHQQMDIESHINE